MRNLALAGQSFLCERAYRSGECSTAGESLNCSIVGLLPKQQQVRLVRKWRVRVGICMNRKVRV